MGSPVPISQIGKLSLKELRSQNLKITKNSSEGVRCGVIKPLVRMCLDLKQNQKKNQNSSCTTHIDEGLVP